MLDTNLSQLIVPGTESIDLNTTLIKVNGSALSDLIRPFSIQITRCANRIPYAIVTFLDGNVAEQRFEVSDTDILSPGHEIEIYSGYHGNNELVFKGMIVRHTVRVLQESQSHIEIECKDKAVKMTVGRKNKYFYDLSDSDVMKEIIRNYGLRAEVEDTSATHREMVQFHATDWDFLVTRADANGLLVMVKDGEVHIKPPALEQEPKFPLTYGVNIFEFEGQMDARDQYPTVKTTIWNPDNQELEESDPGGGGGLGGGLSLPAVPPVVSSAAQIAGGAVGLELPGTPPNTDYTQVMGLEHWPLQHTGFLKAEEAQQWAKAQETKGKLAKKQGRVKFQGIAEIYPGDMLNLQGVGQRHTGDIFVTAVTHEISGGTWYCHVQFGLPQKWFAQEFDDIQEKGGGAIIPPVNGLQIGVVTALENDPENSHRVQVRLPLLDNQGEGTWMRLASQDAGNERGAFWRPEVNDEVVVGFLNDDPRQPIIIGSLYSSANVAPLQATDDNHIKGWVTRSGMKWLFDDEKSSMTLETPKAKKIVVDDDADQIQIEDQHGNKIIMDADGITIESYKNMTLKAAQDLNLEALNVTQKANANFVIEGQSKTEVKAAGQMVVKGSVVNIN
jgi:phage protein D/phage baseplate assembly protein gpV